MSGLIRSFVSLGLLIMTFPASDSSARAQSVYAKDDISHKNNLEGRKLELEIAKLQDDQITELIAPALSAFSILVLAISLIIQRRTARGIQKRSEQTNFELKVAELLMSSPSPAAAEARMNVLNGLYEERLRPGFKNRFDKKDFHGPRFHELRLEVFRQMSAKASSPEEVTQVFRRVFSNEKALYAEISGRVDHNVGGSDAVAQSPVV